MKFNSKKHEVIVIGGGHAGCEAALASSRMGAETLLITHSRETIAQMSCNPAIGGIGKGHLVKEIDAIGGEMGKVADATGIHFRVLNASRGAATRGSRCQSDYLAYKKVMRQKLENQTGLKILEGVAEELLVQGNQVIGLRTNNGEYIGETVIITAGTFLNGLIHRGQDRVEAGRDSEPSVKKLSLSLGNQSLQLGRMKTGTPARLDSRSIDWSKMAIQPGDENPKKFSFWDSEILLPQVVCHIAYTNEKTHRIIQDNLQRSALYGGQISGIGPDGQELDDITNVNTSPPTWWGNVEYWNTWNPTAQNTGVDPLDASTWDDLEDQGIYLNFDWDTFDVSEILMRWGKHGFGNNDRFENSIGTPLEVGQEYTISGWYRVNNRRASWSEGASHFQIDISDDTTFISMDGTSPTIVADEGTTAGSELNTWYYFRSLAI